MTPRTLRGALALRLALAAGLAWVGLGAGLVLGRRAWLTRELDQALLSAASVAVVQLIEQGVERTTDVSLRELLAGTGDGAGALFAEDGRTLAAWSPGGTERLPSPDCATFALPLQPTFAWLSGSEAAVALSRGQLSRLIRLPFRAGQARYCLQLTRPGVTWRSASRVLWVPWLAAGLALAIVVRGVARRVARRTLLPFRGLAEEARRLGPEDHRRRLRLPGADEELREAEIELNAALRRLEHGYLAQASFSGHVAHELKTPLAALLTDLQVLRLTGRETEELPAFLQRAERELRDMSDLIERFLVLARLDRGSVRRERVSLDDVVRRAEQRCRDAAARAGVRLCVELASFTADRPPFVRGDAQLLQVLIENLVHNAIRHSPPGAEVLLHTSFGSDARITVRDQGPGIPAALRQSALRHGLGVLAPSRDSSGSGLGLAIVESVTRVHDGHVRLEESAGGGCAFVVTLPVESGA